MLTVELVAIVELLLPMQVSMYVVCPKMGPDCRCVPEVAHQPCGHDAPCLPSPLVPLTLQEATFAVFQVRNVGLPLCTRSGRTSHVMIRGAATQRFSDGGKALHAPLHCTTPAAPGMPQLL